MDLSLSMADSMLLCEGSFRALDSEEVDRGVPLALADEERLFFDDEDPDGEVARFLFEGAAFGVDSSSGFLCRNRKSPGQRSEIRSGQPH